VARKRNASRVTPKGTDPDLPPFLNQNELPSIRQRRPVMYWVTVLAVLAMVIPLIAGFIQVVF
jgi:hypothetical protein